MSLRRRYVEPPPRVRVIDFAAGKEKDRFCQPTASIQFSPDGKCVYGLQERPACRVLRYQADAASAAESAAAEDRQRARPSGRRHDALYAYLDSLGHMEQRWGVEATQARGAARAKATVYHGTHAGSLGVSACLDWEISRSSQAGLEMPRPTSRPASPGAELERPGTAPASTSLDFWSQVPCGATSPRFKSRAAFEQRRSATPDIDAIKRSGYLVVHQQRKKATAAKEAREAELIQAWPHGLPTSILCCARMEGLHPPAVESCYNGAQIRSELHRAVACGLQVQGLGMGGNPLSLPWRQYQALLPGMKCYG